MTWHNNNFVMGGLLWHIVTVPPDSPELIDRTGIKTVATTDPLTHTVCISNQLKGDFLARVLIHELGHCALISFNLLSDIRRMVKPECWIEAEEWVCNFIADYGLTIFQAAFNVLGYNAWQIVPSEIERLVA